MKKEREKEMGRKERRKNMKKKERKKKQKKRKKDISYPKLSREFGAIKTHGKWWNWLGNLFGNFFKRYYQIFPLRILSEK